MRARANPSSPILLHLRLCVLVLQFYFAYAPMAVSTFWSCSLDSCRSFDVSAARSHLVFRFREFLGMHDAGAAGNEYVAN